jgi:hypothetical protein
MSKKTTELILSAKGLFSEDMRGLPMTTSTYYDRIHEIATVSQEFKDISTVGFYKVGKLLVRAKKELKNDFGKLKKQLAENGLHEKQQERYMSIASNKNIELNYSKLPPQWTTWEKLSRLTPKQWSDVEHMITKEVKWKEIAQELGKSVPVNAKGYHSNLQDNRTEVFGFEYNFLKGTKKHKEEYEQFEKDLKRMKKKYPFIKLKKKNYHQEVVDMLSGKTVKDDTSSKNIDGTDKPKFKKSYQSTKQIDI